MSYRRVVPRDAFNEAKLLKCIGRLSLLVLDNHLYIDRDMAQIEDDLKHDGHGFMVRLDEDNLMLYSDNYYLTVNGVEIALFSDYNSKDNYPLNFYDEEEEEYHRVFKEDGSLSHEFATYLVSLTI